MVKRSTSWAIALFLCLIGLLIPISSFSQVQQPAAGNKADPIEDARDLGELSLDELKARRASIAGSGALGELLLKVARKNPEVLDEPEPSALFLGFGDNSLNFELRAFIDDPMKRFRVSHQLHKAIDDEFRRAGIEIAFPQRDIHLDQIGRLEVNVVSDQLDQAADTRATLSKKTHTPN